MRLPIALYCIVFSLAFVLWSQHITTTATAEDNIVTPTVTVKDGTELKAGIEVRSYALKHLDDAEPVYVGRCITGAGNGSCTIPALKGRLHVFIASVTHSDRSVKAFVRGPSTKVTLFLSNGRTA